MGAVKKDCGHTSACKHGTVRPKKYLPPIGLISRG